MGGGCWSYSDYNSYTTKSRGISADDFSKKKDLSNQEVFKARHLDSALNPRKVTRECCDSNEHPDSFPVILALDVTGSMGDAAVKVAQKLNTIMTDLYSNQSVKDIEFCIMGIGDLAYDDSPIQISQFESDIRIAEQLDKIYFEFGGGGNKYESYTAAWYMGSRHCKLDCWNRGKKGIIITLGDECPNPYLPAHELAAVTGDNVQSNIETKDLYEEVKEKFDVYHISVDDYRSSYDYYKTSLNVDEKWAELLGEDHYKVATLDNLSQVITNIITSSNTNVSPVPYIFGINQNVEEVSW